jgi:hypothetical protein
MMHVEPQKEHQWLKKLVGQWTFESESPGEAGQPPTKLKGSETVRMLGDVWMIGEGQGEMPGGGMGHMVMTIGYDPQKKRFVGSWIGSMMTNFWVYDGFLDESGKVLTLESDGPSMTGEGMSKYRDIIEIVDDNHRILSGNILQADGTWMRFMETHYRRKQ